MEDFEFIGPNDQPALVAVTSQEPLMTVRTALTKMGYKVHVVETHPQFETRYNQINYQVVIIEETFGGTPMSENASLQMIQNLPMVQRRYATFFLIGPTVESLNTMQAFAQSVHCVVNFAELPMLTEVVQKTTAENEMFLNTYLEVQRRVYQKGS